jgi:flagellum-specific ATP synthase
MSTSGDPEGFQGGDALTRAARMIRTGDLAQRRGRVGDLIGLIIEATGLQAEVGELCLVGDDRRESPVPTEVVGFRSGRTLLMPLGELGGIGPGTPVLPTGHPFRVAVGPQLLGRVIDGLGRPMDALGELSAAGWRSTTAPPPDAFSRPRIRERVGLGVALRARPATRDLRGLRRRQVFVTWHDRPLNDRPGERDLARRRARARGA